MINKEDRLTKKAFAFGKNEKQIDILINKISELESAMRLVCDMIIKIQEEQSNTVSTLLEKNTFIYTETLLLADEELEMVIITTDNAFIMCCDNESAIAKCHPEDEYNPMVGYEICKNRLITKLLNKRYN